MTQNYFSPFETKSQSSHPSIEEPPAAGRHHSLRVPSRQNGVGLHNGQNVTVQLLPRPTPGIVFARTDLPNAPEIAASLTHIAHTTHATTLQQEGVTIGTTEHLLAALWAMEVTACRVEVDGPELPILDGSARPWCDLIASSGLHVTEATPRSLWRLRHPVAVLSGDGCVLGLPHPQLRLSAVVEYATSWPSRQSYDLDISSRSFVHELAPARTFTLEGWIEPLRAAGLIRGGSPDNAIVLSDSGPSSPWRFTDELVRHKMLDLLGDIALLFGADDRVGGALQAHLIAVKAGHELHRQWMHECLQQQALIPIGG